jgi:hypothetical protein
MSHPTDEDGRILDRLRDLYTTLDPMPDDLVTLTRFALEIESLDADGVEIATRREDGRLAASGTRGTERVRVITFDSDSLTVMIRVTATDGATLRIDGWIAPAGRHAIELRTAANPMDVTSDENGRFAFDDVPGGMTQFAIDQRGDHTVITPAISF